MSDVASTGDEGNEVSPATPPLADRRPAPDLAAQTLASVRRSSRGSSAANARRSQQRSGSTGPQFTGSGPDDRDPSLLGESIDDLMRTNGWEHKSKVGGVIGRWAQIAGEDLAAHVTPETFDDSTGRLLLRAESTTWATQVRTLIPALQRRLDTEVGTGVVKLIEVVGPSSGRRKFGPLRVKGRGPRDTYG